MNSGTADPFANVVPVEIPINDVSGFARWVEVADLNRSGGPEVVVADDSPASYYPLTLDQDPVANDDAASTSMNRFIDADVLANDTDADGTLDRSTLSIVTMPLHGTARINPAAHTVIYQPDSGFSGGDSLQYGVRDNLGAASNVATLNVTVRLPPVANNDSASATTSQATTINVLGNDVSAGGTLAASTLTITTPPASGTASISAGTFSVTYQSAAGFAGADSFQYTVQDDLGAVSNVATVTVTVTSPPPPPPPPSGGGGGGGGALGGFWLVALGGLALIRRWRFRRASAAGCGGRSDEL